MKISIITATYNCENTIERTIRSVLNQKEKDIEYIVVDGRSTDNTIPIVKKYASLYRNLLWISEPDLGIYDALNKGVQMASGKYVNVIGADDEFLSDDVLRKIKLDLEDNVDFLSAPVIAVNNKLCIEKIFSNENHIMMPHQGVFVKRKLLLNHPFDLTYSVSADSEFILSCLFDDSISKKIVTYPITYYALGGFSSNVEKMKKDWLRICNKYRISPIDTPANVCLIEAKIKDKIRNILSRFSIFKYVYIFKGWNEHISFFENNIK